FEFLIKNGFDLSRKNTYISLSMGTMYGIPQENYSRIFRALKEYFPDCDLGKHLLIDIIYGGDKKSTLDIYYRTLESIRKNLDGIKKVRRKNSCTLFTTKVYRQNGSPVEISMLSCIPEGRARLNIPAFQNLKIHENLTPHDLEFNPDLNDGLVVRYNGDVGFGLTGKCIRDGKIYGNINGEHLMRIAARIQEDSVYQAFKLGGVRFLSHLSQQVSNFNIRGIHSCDVCHDIFSDIPLLEKIRKHLSSHEVVPAYREFIDSLDFRKRTVM
ncbi:MAG: hypothetical protein Q8N88_06960, partial [Nanoarchaeota archaeon]|nr:hypothetical protein [Nanoarchaeota archaeon]